MAADPIDNLKTKKDFADTPQGKYKYWATELKASQKARSKWHKQADDIVRKFRGQATSKEQRFAEQGARLNLFHSNIKTLSDMMYGNTPKIDVARRYAQPEDDVGRVSAEMMERLLNLDLANDGADFDAVMRSALQDRLLAGLGCAKCRYEFEAEEVPTGMIDAETGEEIMQERLINEYVPTEYFYWGDILWSWCRTWADMRWIAFRSYLGKDEIEARFGANAANNIPLKKQTVESDEDAKGDEDTNSAWQRGEIWEIWNKEDKTVHWVAFGYDKQLEQKDDPLQLTNFWPIPPFLMANVTTSLYEPTPDFALTQDLYNQIDDLQNRITVISDAVKVVGVYNAANKEIGNVMSSGVDNQLIPVENWALFGENGGLGGQMEWVPLKDVTSALMELKALRDETIGLLQQVTGMTDIMRGSLNNQYEGVGQSEIKAKYGSVRIQSLQEQFATFASNLMQIKAEIISKHFSPETIVQRSNMEYSPDRDLVPQAVELIKNPNAAKLRIVIRPESVAMIDYTEMKQERTAYLTAISTFMQSAAPLMDNDPSAKPFLLQLLQWGLSGFKGADEIEGVVDKAIAASTKEQEGEQPSEAQMQAQAQQQLEQMKMQNEMQKLQAKVQGDIQVRNNDLQADMQTAQQAHQFKLQEIAASMEASIAETQVDLQGDLLRENAQAASNIKQTMASVEGEIQKDVVAGQIDMAKEEMKTENSIRETVASAKAEIAKAAKTTSANEGTKDD